MLQGTTRTLVEGVLASNKNIIKASELPLKKLNNILGFQINFNILGLTEIFDWYTLYLI